MTAQEAIQEMELAAWEMAEAQTALKSAQIRMTAAGKKLASANLFLKEALEQAQKQKAKK